MLDCNGSSIADIPDLPRWIAEFVLEPFRAPMNAGRGHAAESHFLHNEFGVAHGRFTVASVILTLPRRLVLADEIIDLRRIASGALPNVRDRSRGYVGTSTGS